MCVHILNLVLKHFSATLQQLSPSMRLTKVLAKEKLSGFLGKTLQKLCLRGTLENLKHALSLDDARNKRWEGSSQTKIGNAQKDSTLCHTISTVIVPNLKNILMDKWHLIQNQPLPREIFREPPLISYRKGKSLKDMLVKAEL